MRGTTDGDRARVPCGPDHPSGRGRPPTVAADAAQEAQPDAQAVAGLRSVTAPDSAIPQVAVVTAAYNIGKYIGETIASVLAQSLPNFEMVVVDDGSRDATARIVAAVDDPRVRLISIPNSGAGAARNRGLAACRAPLVVFLDADDLLLPDALERMAATMAANPGHVACFGHHIKIDEDGAALGSSKLPAFRRLPAEDTLRHLLCRNVIVNGGALCIRTDAAHRVGGYDSSLRFAEDLEFWCRLAVLSDFVPMSDCVVLKYRLRRSGANWRLAGTPFHPNFEALEVIFAAPALSQRFTERERRRYRRLAEINTHWLAARNAFTEGRLVRFAQYLLVGALRYPDSLLQWSLLHLFFRGLPLSRQRG
jgi:glycosyltransferase involved in cell wall biosynthesis